MSTSIVAVSYLNTTPFIYGIQEKLSKSEFELSIEHPAKCASILINNEADIGLVPVVVLPQLIEYVTISDYCIACDGAVDTVCLYSEVPLPQIDLIYLDYQSKTSVNLIKILAEKLWKISPKWKNADADYIQEIGGNSAGLVIGDRAFELTGKYKYMYDLGAEWKKLTGLPFVFACWVAKKAVPEHSITQFNQALRYGVENKKNAITNLKSVPNVGLDNYLENRILFEMDAEKNGAIDLFLNYLATPIINR
ncbi:MAG: menaquinone biosynthesis protein [Flavobacteriales bacterium]|nr:menaquinone biosynthesis protein [Flavobacteriales bacterium]